MKVLLLILVTGLIMGSGYAFLAYIRRRRRRIAFDSPFPEAWEKILTVNLPVYRKFPSSLRQQLHGLINVFISEKSFEGCAGLELTDEIRVTIAAQACMLLLNRRVECYPKLYSVLVYPSTYVAGGRTTLRGEWEEESVRLGESWHSGAVVLAWDNVRHGAVNFQDGHNVTMHEFAHQLDQEDGVGDGTPVLETRSAYSSWARVFSREYGLLQKKTRRGRESVLDSYGATNPAEFFAVATETFFEKPRQLNTHHPKLFEEIRKFYRVNPLEWL